MTFSSSGKRVARAWTVSLLLGLAGSLGTAALAAVDSASPAEAGMARVIVSFKSTASDRAQILSANPVDAASRMTALGTRSGLALRGGFSLGPRSQVVMAHGLASADLAARLSALPDVEYAVVDRRRRAYAVPNDPLYSVGGSRGPVVGQWYLRPPTTTTPAAINAESAWDTTLGSSSVVVAVLDTGVRFDHADLLPVAQGGNLLPGYDFVSDTNTANDGDGRDADASDPGDWITAAEANTTGSPFFGCTRLEGGRYIATNSSWHGTEVAALIAANTNNGLGMASVGRSVRLLPVRVLGKCGGFDSDIIAGMRWAAGLPVPGVPGNTTPAKVINLSLGGTGTCEAAYLNAIAEVNAVGAVVVASGGNSTGHAVSEPANCAGVIAVAAVRHIGTKVGFSDLGPEIALAAPGGNCVDLSGACQYPILTARNAGTTAAVIGSSIFSDSFTFTVGTSFSAPLVAGATALMFSVKPGMTPTEARNILQQTARAFPTTGGENVGGAPIAQCLPPQFDSAGRPIDQDQCYCTTGTCGAGMLDVGAAVRAAALSVPPPSTIPMPTPNPTPTPTPTAPVATSDGGGGGGGALGWLWLMALFAAVAALRVSRPEAPTQS